MTRDPAKTDRASENPIGALYRRMSSWYVVFSLVLFIAILLIGLQLARPLLPHLLGK